MGERGREWGGGVWWGGMKRKGGGGQEGITYSLSPLPLFHFLDLHPCMPVQTILFFSFRPAFSSQASPPLLLKGRRSAIELRMQVIVLALEAIHLALQIGVQGETDSEQKDWHELITIPDAAD